MSARTENPTMPMFCVAGMSRIVRLPALCNCSAAALGMKESRSLFNMSPKFASNDSDSTLGMGMAIPAARKMLSAADLAGDSANGKIQEALVRSVTSIFDFPANG